MYAQVEKPKENKSGAIAISVAQQKSKGKGREASIGFVDNRSEAVAQRKLQDTINNNNPEMGSSLLLTHGR